MVWWCLLGGAIYRSAAVEWATEERISLGDALRYARQRAWSYFGSGLLLIFCIALLIAINYGCGWIIGALQNSIAPAGYVALALLWIPLLISGLLIFFLAVALFFTPGLMFSAVAVDNSDHYNAVSRGMMYFFHCFAKYLLYHLIALFYGMWTVFVVTLCALATWWITCRTVEWGMGHIITIWSPWHGVTANFQTILFAGIFTLYYGLLAGFVISQYVCFKTIIYTLLRNAIEGKELEAHFTQSDFTATATSEKPEISQESTSEAETDRKTTDEKNPPQETSGQ